METLNYIGVLTIEFFEVAGALIANEMAPRVHNSGHWTIEGAVTCQFENHVRAITGLPLGSTATRFSSVMLNCIGSMPPAEKALKIEGVHLHDYGKVARKGRKVGHITVCDEPAGGPALQDKVALLDDLVSSARTTVL
jgi:5-(carboxyamino)imidazole ribonucleotide synthase